MREINLQDLDLKGLGDALDIIVIVGFAFTAVIILIPVILMLKEVAGAKAGWEKQHLHLVRQPLRHRRTAPSPPSAVPDTTFEPIRKSVLPHIRGK